MTHFFQVANDFLLGEFLIFHLDFQFAFLLPRGVLRFIVSLLGNFQFSKSLRFQLRDVVLLLVE